MSNSEPTMPEESQAQEIETDKLWDKAGGRRFTEEEWEDIRKILKTGSLSSFFEVLERHFEVKDRTGFTIILASAAAHQVPGEMLWLRIYGASRSGKTELLGAIARHGDSTEMEVITPASIRGGLKGGHKLLNRLNGKLVITKDLATMLTSKREARNEVFGLLRNVKDGRLTADFGIEEKEGYVTQEATFDWLIGTTPVFAQYRQMEDLLGARYIDLNWKVTGNREEIAFRALENNPQLGMIRQEMAKTVGELIDRAKRQYQIRVYEKRFELLERDKRLIANWADLTALLRSPVARDRLHKVKFHPEPEVGTDLAQGFSRIVAGLALLDIYEYERYLGRLACDSIPYSRREIIKKLVTGGKISPPDHKTPSDTYYELEDMKLLGIVELVGSDWKINPQLRARIDPLALYF